MNILPKLRYFEGRYDIQIGYKNNQYFCFPDRPMKGGDILDIPRKERGILKKGGGGGMTPLTNYESNIES